MKQTISNRQGKQLAVYTDGLKDAPVLVFSNSGTAWYVAVTGK